MSTALLLLSMLESRQSGWPSFASTYYIEQCAASSPPYTCGSTDPDEKAATSNTIKLSAVRGAVNEVSDNTTLVVDTAVHDDYDELRGSDSEGCSPKPQ